MSVYSDMGVNFELFGINQYLYLKIPVGNTIQCRRCSGDNCENGNTAELVECIHGETSCLYSQTKCN